MLKEALNDENDDNEELRQKKELRSLKSGKSIIEKPEANVNASLRSRDSDSQHVAATSKAQPSKKNMTIDTSRNPLNDTWHQMNMPT